MRVTHEGESRQTRRGAVAPRRGVALMVALLATVLIGALVAGAVYSSTQEYRIGRYATQEPRAMTIAEWGLNAAAADLRRTARPLTAAAPTVLMTALPTAANGDRAEVRLTRLTDTTYVLTSTGSAGNTTAGVATATTTERRTSLLLRMVRPQINFLAALTTNGPTTIGGSSMVTGTDNNPGTWSDCDALAASKPAVVTNDIANLGDTTKWKPGQVSGASPPAQEDPAAGDTSTYFKYGNDADWASLAAMADITLPAGTNIKPLPLPDAPWPAGTPCAYSSTNWGEPLVTAPASPCVTHFPLIYAKGDLHLSGGRGQGILLVNGDLEVQGKFEFYGPVIVRGRIKTTGTGGHFHGGVMAANVDLEQNTVLGDAEIIYSSCAITRALNGVASQRPVGGNRSWTALY